MKTKVLGWQITVERPGRSAAEVFNVAISDDRQAVEAVKRTFPEGQSAVVKVKAALSLELYKALNMKPGDVKVVPHKNRPAASLVPRPDSLLGRLRECDRLTFDRVHRGDVDEMIHAAGRYLDFSAFHAEHRAHMFPV